MEFKLFMMLLGCKPKGRIIEQHDIFFGIATSVKELIPNILEFWPEANGKIHIDVWREVTCVDDKLIRVVPKDSPADPLEIEKRVFFLNLGGYKKEDFEEYHYKMLVLGEDKSEATTKAKETAFFKHTGFEGANSHIDDKYGIDVDDIYEIIDILPPLMKEQYRIIVTDQEAKPDTLHAGYQKLGMFN
jgi:hypothetical protein